MAAFKDPEEPICSQDKSESSFESLCEGLRAPEPNRTVAVRRLQVFLEDEGATKLSLGGLELEALPVAYFANPRVCVKLEVLCCDNNQLRELPLSLSACINLEELYCEHNQLAYLPPELSACVKLKILYCRNNQLKELPTALGVCVELEDLICENNQLRELPRELGACVKLKALWCYNNRLEELPPELGACLLLTELDYNNNPLKEAPKTPRDLQAQWAILCPRTKSAGKT